MGSTHCVITGLGMISALGGTADECFEAALNGVSGICEVKSFDTAECYSHNGCEVKLSNAELCGGDYDRSSLLCIKAASEAIEDSGITLSKENPDRVGVVLGSCVGGAASIDKFYTDQKNGAEDAGDILKMPASAISANIAEYFGVNGITANIVNACAAGTLSIAYACDIIRQGKADVFIAGGTDSFSSLAYAGFHALHALAEDKCSPFNHSDGITLGEGSGILIIESAEHAKSRSAKIYCEVLGAGVSSDAYHITAPRPDGEGQMDAITRAVKNSSVEFSDIGYINAHGTGTAKNDEAEFLSLKTLFPEPEKLSVSSTKSQTGHCLGAAGAIEAVLTVKALCEEALPPTVGYSEDDKAALHEKSGGIDFLANEAERKAIDYAMSNSFAFGGNNASVIFSKKPHEILSKTNSEPIYITGIGEAVGVKNPETGNYEVDLSTATFKALGVKGAFLRKLDRFSRLSLLSGKRALANAGIDIPESGSNRIGLIIGTSDGPLTEISEFQKNVIQKGVENGSAFSFPNTVYNAAGGYLSINTGIKGYNVTIANGCQAGLQSVCYACDVIRSGEQDTMLAQGTDEATDVEYELYSKLGLLDKMTLSEGSVSFVLEAKSAAEQSGNVPFAEIIGYATARESVPFGKISGTANALKKTVLSALRNAGCEASDVSEVWGFSNGAAEVDGIELSVFGEIFGDSTRLLNIKSKYGEARAASAALQLAKACENIENTETGISLAVSFAVGGMYTAVVIKRV